MNASVPYPLLQSHGYSASLEIVIVRRRELPTPYTPNVLEPRRAARLTPPRPAVFALNLILLSYSELGYLY